MKIQKHIVLPIIISLILFIIPFFWFKPGEMDLGGDSSRLYFYDPASYLFKSALFAISPSSFGFENLNYINAPFVALLIVFKSIIFSQTIMISAFYGFSLSMAFIFCYLIIKELIYTEKGWYAAVVGGLLYVLSPALIDGWKHVLITYNQVFLNPLIFYLLLKYFKTAKLYFVFIIIILTFVFSSNFGIAASPPIFAFYPLSVLFLILYTKLILKKKIIVKHLIVGLILFIGVQVFHMLPQILNVFSKGSDVNSTIFSEQGKFNRGLSYFSAIVPNIKASINLLGLPQMRPLNLFSNVFLISPFVMVFGIILNKKKTILLTSFFFIIVLFFATANITNIWLSFYKSLFAVPGFSMFRNFYGQWQYSYIFFYSILFGQTLYVVLSKLNRKRAYVLIFFLITIFAINAIPLIRGSIVGEMLWQSNNIKGIMKMDSEYEKALSFIRSLPADGRVLTLPLSDPGYQIVAGTDGGAYMGPSTIAYLGGKKDFSGYGEFGDYGDLILKLVRDNQTEALKKIFGFLNIKYIFYNADPKIYNEFPAFPYQHVRELLPNDQDSYKKFIQKLDVREIKNIKNKFYVFELQDNYYFPQINIAKSIYFNQSFEEVGVPLSIDGQNDRIAISNINQVISKDSPIRLDESLIDIQDRNSFLDFFRIADYSVGFPYAFSAWPMDSIVYPFVVLRENLQLSKIKKIDEYIETAILLADKRIGELERWGREVAVLGNVKTMDIFNQSWREPTMWEALINRDKYNYWEIGLLRYKRQIEDLMNKIEKPNDSLYSTSANKKKLKKAVVADRERFYTIIEEEEKLSKKNKSYLLKLCANMFSLIESKLQSIIPSPKEVYFNLNGLEKGEYEIFIDKKSIESADQSETQIIINDSKFYLKDFQQDGEWYRGQGIVIENKKNNILTLLSAQSANLISNDQWKLSEEKILGDNSTSLSIADINLPNSNGLINRINSWTSNSYYLLSFEYLTHGKSFKVIAYDRVLQKDNFGIVFEDDLRSSEWNNYKVIFKSSSDAYLASLQILKSERGLLDTIDTKDKNSKIEIKNFSIIRVPNPRIVLRKANTSSQKEIQPKITFTRINPAKYEVKVENANAPYTLVLANQFNTKWKLINPAQDAPTLLAFFSRLIGSFGNFFGGLSKIEDSSVKSAQLIYFGGDIVENSSGDIFINNKTFETWGKSEIAVNKHFSVNGYSNAWYIEPKDMNGKNSYTLIIEITTQNMIYLGLGISILTLILTIVFLIRNLLKK